MFAIYAFQSTQVTIPRGEFAARRLSLINATPITQSERGLQLAALQSLLSKLGYLSTKSKELINNKLGSKAAVDGRDFNVNPGLTNGILRYQAFYGLTKTGTMDDATKQHLLDRACGVPDYPSGFWDRIGITLGAPPPDDRAWSTRHELTYVAYLPTDFNPGFEGAIRRAAATWSRACNLTLRQVTSSGDIVLRFTDMHHIWQNGTSCPYSFPAGEKAHAFFPSDLVHEAHFGIMFPWAIGSAPDMESFALHEFGHAIGLQHAQYAQSNVMFKSVRTLTALSPDDSGRAEAIYGVRPS